MPSQLFANEGISFVAAKPFTYRGVEYTMGDDFPQEEANNIETLVRARFVIPVLEEGYLRPRHWHKHIRTREQAQEYLNRDRVQLRMHTEPDSDELVNLEQLVDPNRPDQTEGASEDGVEDVLGEAAQAQQEQVEAAAEAVHSDQYDPSYHTVVEVNTYLASADDEEYERVMQAERDGRGRKGILEA